MKNLARKAVLGSGLLRIAGHFRSCSAAILIYHSVMEDPRDQNAFLGGMGHSRHVFRGHMELLARRYHPASLGQVRQFVRGEGELPDRSVAVTFDDGYTDNYEIAAPVLNELGVPATFYATVDCVEQRKLPWPGRLWFLFHNTKTGDWSDSSGKTWPLSSGVEREKAMLRSCDECCQLAGTEQEMYVARLAAELDTEVPARSGALMMNYDQLQALAGQGHIVGSHTMTHPNMAYVNPAAARRELTESKLHLEQQLKRPVAHFS